LKNRNHKNFYRKQNELIDHFVAPLPSEEEARQQESDLENDPKVKIALNLSLAVNVGLFVMQIVAAILSGSLALIATSADAFMDLLSGFILWMTARSKSKKNAFVYPTGKSRMEPVGIIIFAALMSTVSIQLIIEASQTLAKGNSEVAIKYITYILVGTAIGAKVLLWLYCRVLTYSPSAMTLAQDHRNDIVVNSLGVGFAIMGFYVRWWLDPCGALFVAVIILRSWTITAYEHFGLLVGQTAPPEFLQRLTYIAMTHHQEVMNVDTIRAFHVGNNYYVEADIVLPKDMVLEKTHDIGESLQIKFEKLPEVERAFVHCDYEYRHKPEHKTI